jgi:hypothetical protein
MPKHERIGSDVLFEKNKVSSGRMVAMTLLEAVGSCNVHEDNMISGQY